MTEKTAYTITGAEVSLNGGVKVVADLNTVEGIAKLIADLQVAGLEPAAPVLEKQEKSAAKTLATESDDPAHLIETQAGLDAGKLREAKILAVKDGAPQLLRTTIFSKVMDAILVLMLALEVGLKKNPVNYDDFSALFESHNLKSGSPLSMLVTNLRNAGYLDNRIYSEGRKLRLTAKGQAKAIEVLKNLATT